MQSAHSMANGNRPYLLANRDRPALLSMPRPMDHGKRNGVKPLLYFKVSNWTEMTKTNLSNIIVGEINALVESLGGFGFCAELSPKNDATQLSIWRNVKQSDLFKIQLMVLPSNGTFEVYVKGEPNFNVWDIQLEFSRLDSYGSQGDCVLHLDGGILICVVFFKMLFVGYLRYFNGLKRPLCYCLDLDGDAPGVTISTTGS